MGLVEAWIPKDPRCINAEYMGFFRKMVRDVQNANEARQELEVENLVKNQTDQPKFLSASTRVCRISEKGAKSHPKYRIQKLEKGGVS